MSSLKFKKDLKSSARDKRADCRDNETVYIFKNGKSLVKIHSYCVRHYKKKIT